MSEKEKNFDFTIIGAGPMGLYLSYLLSENNYKVRLIGIQKFKIKHYLLIL